MGKQIRLHGHLLYVMDKPRSRLMGGAILLTCSLRKLEHSICGDRSILAMVAAMLLSLSPPSRPARLADRSNTLRPVQVNLGTQCLLVHLTSLTYATAFRLAMTSQRSSEMTRSQCIHSPKLQPSDIQSPTSTAAADISDRCQSTTSHSLCLSQASRMLDHRHQRSHDH